MVSVVFLCGASLGRCAALGGKAPMILLAPLIGWIDWTLSHLRLSVDGLHILHGPVLAGPTDRCSRLPRLDRKFC